MTETTDPDVCIDCGQPATAGPKPYGEPRCMACFNDWTSGMDDHPNDEPDDDPAEFDYDCGWSGRKGDVCTAAGSEDCDWECPYSPDYHRSMGRG